MSSQRRNRDHLRLTMPRPGDHGKTPFRFLLLPELRTRIEQQLNVTDILPLLCNREYQLVDDDLQQQIRSVRGYEANKERLDILLDHIVSASGPQTLERFQECLAKAGYRHTHELIQNELIKINRSTKDSQRTIALKVGLVPAEPEIYVVREAYIHKIKDEIIKASERARVKHGTQWVVIHGMPGHGKSYLAAAALRAPDMNTLCFNSGVYWLNIGKPGMDKLSIKLGMLLQMSGAAASGVASAVSPTSTTLDTETVVAQLAAVFATQHPNSAIVLDDVWNKAVLQTFERISCKVIIVTTRHADIAGHIIAPVAKVCVDSGFNEAESQEYFAKTLEKSVDELPEETRLIHEHCRGAPLTVSLFGGILRDDPHNPRRLQRCLQTLTERPSEVLEMPTAAYENKTIQDTIALSVENLKMDLQEKLYDFVVFDDDIAVPVDVFHVLWNTQTVDDADDEMAYFVNASLCSKEYCLVRERNVYHFHDLILQYIRKNIPVKDRSTLTAEELELAREKMVQDKHRKLYQKYRDKCRGKLEDLDNDYYFHNFIGYHMSQGKLMADREKVYRDMGFLEKRLAYAGAEVVRVDIALLQKQHPYLKGILKNIETILRQKYDQIKSPDLNALSTREKRQSWLLTDPTILAQHSRRGSAVSISSFAGMTDECRDRASSMAHESLRKVVSNQPGEVVHRPGMRRNSISEPAQLTSPDSGNEHVFSSSSSNTTSPVPLTDAQVPTANAKLNYNRDLRSDQFEDY